MDDPRLVRAKALFEQAVAAIDKRAEDLAAKMMQDAYAALLRGDTAERDRLCSRDAQEALRKSAEAAKTEAWARAGEAVGMDGDMLRAKAPDYLRKRH